MRRRDVAVAANGLLKVGDGAHTVTSSGGWAPVANSGTGTSTTYYGFDAVTGSLTSRPDVTLKDGAIVSGNLITAGQIVRVGDKVNGSVTGAVTEHAAFTTQDITYTVTFPPVSNGPVRLEPNTQATMAPGRYGAVNVKAGSTIFLRTGSTTSTACSWNRSRRCSSTTPRARSRST